MADAVRITEKSGFAMAAILARRGVSAAAIGKALAIDLPLAPGWTTRGAIVAIGNGPGTWLVEREAFDPGWIGDMRGRVSGLASVSDQSAAYRVFRIEGPAARTLLQRGMAIDLDRSVFGVGSAVTTAIAHMDAVVRCVEGTDVYEVAVYRSVAESFLRWLDSGVGGL